MSKSRSHSGWKDNYGMSQFHRDVLKKCRPFIVQNMAPTEIFWSNLESREILSRDMLDNIKMTGKSIQTQIGEFLSILPTRGPEAFDNFCQCLLESSHEHVADHIKNMEADTLFQREIKEKLDFLTVKQLEEIVVIFKKSTPTIRRYTETKFKTLWDEQAQALDQTDGELSKLNKQNSDLKKENLRISEFRNDLEIQKQHVKELQNKNEDLKYDLRQLHKKNEDLKKENEQFYDLKDYLEYHKRAKKELQNEIATLKSQLMAQKTLHDHNQQLVTLTEQLKSGVAQCKTEMKNIVDKIRNDSISQSFLVNEKIRLNDLKNDDLPDNEGSGVFCLIYDCLIEIISYLETRCKDKTSEVRIRTGHIGGSLQHKCNYLHRELTSLTDSVCDGNTSLSADTAKINLEDATVKFDELVDNIFLIKDFLKSIYREKCKLQNEVLILIPIFSEIRELENDRERKQHQMDDLVKHGHIAKSKTSDKKVMEEINQKIQEKTKQIDDIHSNLKQRMKSADKRIRTIFNLLPDLRDSEDEELCSESVGSYSKVESPSPVSSATKGSSRPSTRESKLSRPSGQATPPAQSKSCLIL